MLSEQLRRDLDTLGLNHLSDDDVNQMAMKDAVKAYRQAALKVHPDKAGSGSTAAFQELTNVYKRLLTFRNVNFPRENKGSFTVVVEDSQADIWESCLEKLYGVPVLEKSNDTAYGKYWKVVFTVEEQTSELTVHIYNKPKSRKKKSNILVQGGIQHLNCLYVFEELSKIYKQVCKQIPSLIPNERKTRSSCLVSCGLCKKETTVIELKKHMTSVHSNRTPTHKRKLPMKSTAQEFFNTPLSREILLDASVFEEN